METVSTLEAGKALVRRWLREFWTEADYGVADELCTEDYTVHDPQAPDVPPGRAGIKGYAGYFHQACSGLEVTVEDLIAEGDKVVARWLAEGTHTGPLGPIPASGKRLRVQGTDIYRIADGKLAEAWTSFDRLGMLQQIGAVPRSGHG